MHQPASPHNFNFADFAISEKSKGIDNGRVYRWLMKVCMNTQQPALRSCLIQRLLRRLVGALLFTGHCTNLKKMLSQPPWSTMVFGHSYNKDAIGTKTLKVIDISCYFCFCYRKWDRCVCKSFLNIGYNTPSFLCKARIEMHTW